MKISFFAAVQQPHINLLPLHPRLLKNLHELFYLSRGRGKIPPEPFNAINITISISKRRRFCPTSLSILFPPECREGMPINKGFIRLNESSGVGQIRRLSFWWEFQGKNGLVSERCGENLM